MAFFFRPLHRDQFPVIACLAFIALAEFLAVHWSGHRRNGVVVYDQARWNEIVQRVEARMRRTGTVREASRTSDAAASARLARQALLSEDQDQARIDGLIARAMKEAIRPRQILFNHRDLARDIYENLEIRSFRSSLQPAHIEHLSELSRIRPARVVTNEHSLTIESDDWNYQFEILASGDFNRDGGEDLLVLFHDDAKTGTYDSTSPLLLTRDGSKAIKACDLMPAD